MDATSTAPLAAEREAANAWLASALANLGYPPYEHRRTGGRAAPDATLLAALDCDYVEARIVEGLPWIVFRFHPELDWDWVIADAVGRGCQNRLGFVVTLARRVAERLGNQDAGTALLGIERALIEQRLDCEGCLCNSATINQAERKWLATNRTADAATWHLLTDLCVEHLKPSAFGTAQWTE